MKTLGLSVFVLLISGCATGVVDRTSDVSHETSKCLSIKKPAFIYEARCADIHSSGFGGEIFCDAIQSFAPFPLTEGYASPRYYDYPNSWDDYLKDRSSWDRKLFPKRLFEKKQRTIISPIDVGTKINVAGVYEYPFGTAGHVLIVRARIVSGPYKGEIIDLPTSFGREGYNGPIWVIPEFYFELERNGLRYSSEFLEKCPSNT